MAKKTYRFHGQIVVADPTTDQPAVTDPSGTIMLMPAVKGTKLVAPGQPVELEEAEGARILAIVGPYREPPDTKGPQVMK